MKTKLDCHRVLAGRGRQNGYIQALDIAEIKDKSLRAARDLIRDHLRSGLANWQSILSKRDLFETSFTALGSVTPVLRPRFRMQGSMVYATANEPAYVPPQEIDLDDGLYMPISFLTMQGQLRPALASKGFFAAVERILEPLCHQKGWTLNKSKSTCVRIEISNDAHIDLPLYAIPDSEFQTLVEASASLAADSLMKRNILDGVELAEDSYRQLAADRIMLAHRKEGWKQSDPRKIEDWFRGAIDVHGLVLRRLCRYLKGWRDFQWQNGKLSSIAIMACVVIALDKLRGSLPESRDDFALLEVAKALPGLLAQPVQNPIPGLPLLCEGWAKEHRSEMVLFAEKLRDNLEAALNGTLNREVAIRRLTSAFGERIPVDQSLIIINDEEAEVLAHKAVRVSSPLVTRTTSG